MSLLDELKRRNVIRVAIAYVTASWLLIQILETLFPIFGLPETSIRLIVIALLVGLLPAVLLAWYFELTPAGLKRDAEARNLPRETKSSRTFDRVISIALILAVGYFAIDKFVIDPSRDAEELAAAKQEGRAEALVQSYGDKSIVVLPFTNMSSDPEQEFLGDGLAEELLNLLSRNDELRVISRTSAFSFKGKDVTTKDIASDLNVAYVLEGSVRKSGASLRITAQLIDARADAHVWSDTYDRTIEDIFAIQDDVAAEVVRQLKIELSIGTPTIARRDPVAYALFLQAHQKFKSGSYDSIDEIEVLLMPALERDPEYPDAKVLLAWVYESRELDARKMGDEKAAQEYYERAQSLIAEAAKTDPDNVLTHVWHFWSNTRDLRGAAWHIEQALEVDPTNSDVLNAAATLMTRLWKADEAVKVLRYAAERDPLNGGVIWNLARALRNAGEHEAAEQTLRTYLTFQPDADRATWGIGLALLMQSKPEQALRHFDENVAATDLRIHGRVLSLHNLGQTEQAAAEVARLHDEEANSDILADRHHYLLGTAYAWMGLADEAFRHFEQQRDIDSGVFRIEADSPLYAKLRDDPRWILFLASVELAPDFLASVEFDPRLPAGIR